MTPQEIRLEVLKLLRLPDLASPDIEKVLQRAKALEAYVMGAGHAERPLQQAHTPQPHQVRNTQPVAGPARK